MHRKSCRWQSWEGFQTSPNTFTRGMVSILDLFRRVRENSLVPEKFLSSAPQRHRHAHTRIQKAFLLAQASCRFLCKVPLGWLLSLCSCLSSSLRALFPQGPLIPKAYMSDPLCF